LFNGEFDNGNSGAAKTIDFTTGSLQKVVLTAVCAFTLIPPTLPGYFQLKLQAGAGAGQPTFATQVNWFEATTPPTVSLVLNKFSILSLYYDGANWFGSGGRYGL
jgi:hypothetical protein